MNRACALRAVSMTYEEKADIGDLNRTALGGSRWVIFGSVAASSVRVRWGGHVEIAAATATVSAVQRAPGWSLSAFKSVGIVLL